MDVKVGGSWLHSYGHVSDAKWSDSYGAGPTGPDLASCSVALDPSNDAVFLRIGQACEVWEDGLKVFGGRISGMGRDFPRALEFRSWSKMAADFDAITAAGVPTMNPRTAVVQAIADGLPWTGGGLAFPNSSIGADPSPMPLRLDALLDQAAITLGKRWGVDAEGRGTWVSDPTIPTWHLDASDLEIGVASDGLYTKVRATYFSALDVDGNPTSPLVVTANDAPGQAIYGVRVYPMDLTGLGVLSSVTAQSYADQQLALLTVPQWLSRVAVTSAQLRTPGGHGAVLADVRAGQMVRLFNVPNNVGGLRNELALDVVIGETEHDSTSPTQLQIAPVGLAVRNLLDALTEAARAAKAAA